MSVQGDVYLQVRRDPRWTWGLKVVRATQRRPRKLVPGTLLIKLRVEVPRAAFAPLEPTATITVPASMTEAAVSVTASDPKE